LGLAAALGLAALGLAALGLAAGVRHTQALVLVAGGFQTTWRGTLG
jgi:hypothetical protein